MIIDKPWGKVATYALNQPSSVRVITVEPGAETSVHYHRMRDETWVVLDAGRESGIPVIFQVLAVDELAQAEARAGGVHGNKGWEAAEAVLSMASLLEALPQPAAAGEER